MHVPDGFLSPQITVPAWAVAVPLWSWSARRHFGEGEAAVARLPAMGSLTALAFAIQAIQVPVPGGTSTHLVGVTLLALLYGPLVAFTCESLVLLVQALFFGSGGITALAVNALAMGLAGPLAGWLAFRALRRLGERLAAFAAAWLSTQAAALLLALVLGLQHRLSERIFPVPLEVLLPAMLLPGLLVTGLVEGAYTVLSLALLRKADPGALPAA